MRLKRRKPFDAGKLNEGQVNKAETSVQNQNITGKDICKAADNTNILTFFLGSALITGTAHSNPTEWDELSELVIHPEKRAKNGLFRRCKC